MPYPSDRTRGFVVVSGIGQHFDIVVLVGGTPGACRSVDVVFGGGACPGTCAGVDEVFFVGL